jgi:hypothetical protein
MVIERTMNNTSLAILMIVVVTLIPAGCGLSGPSRDGAKQAGADACRPVIAALDGYHKAKGRYPERLDDLVTAGFLDRIPEIPDLGGSRQSGLFYEVAPPIDLYRLRFSYDIPDGLFGAIVGFTYLSDEREWGGRKYGSSMWDEASERAAKRWREKGDLNSLSTFMEVVLVRPDRLYFYESRVQEWLGGGKSGKIPPTMPGGGGKCTIYRAAGVGTGYGFSFRPHSLPLSGDKTLEAPLVDRIYEIRGSGDDERWKILLDRE